MGWLWLLWWCFDDHLAAAVGEPGLGSLPFWVPVLISLCTITVSNRERD